MTSPSFNFAQTFTIDSSVGNQTSAKLTGIDLFFMYKPPAITNVSTTQYPGVTIWIVPTSFDVPQITPGALSNFARVEWNSILTSSNATVPTRFRFNQPIMVKPNTKYAIVGKYDNNEFFYLWTARSGKLLIGSNETFSGTFPSNVGQYFEGINFDQSDPTEAKTQQQIQSYWRSLDGTELKFRVYVARYFLQGMPVASANLSVSDQFNYTNSAGLLTTSSGNNQITYSYPSQCVENITFDVNKSTVQTYVGAQRVYQNTVFYPGGYANGSSYMTLSTNSSQVIVANSNFPNGQAFDWANVYGSYTGTKFLVLFDSSVTNVRRVISQVNSTALMLDEPVTFTNSSAKFMISPVGTLDSLNSAKVGGVNTAFMFLAHSNANSSVRFVNTTIESVSITAGGNGYSNSDVLYVTGYEYVSGKVQGGYAAVGNIVTNSSGGMTAVYLSNTGCGFGNTAAMKIVVANSSFLPASLSNSSTNTSGGSGANLSFTVGATLQTELTNNIFKNCSVVNLDVHDATPYFNVTSPSGTAFGLTLQMLYYMKNDTSTLSGYSYYVNPNYATKVYSLNLMTKNFLQSNVTPCFVSYSNEFNTAYENGSPNDKVNPLVVYSNNYVLNIQTTSNNDYVVMSVDTTPTVEFGKYIINNDYTAENTNKGAAWAKHLTTLTNFSRLSEDIRVYLEAYRPANTDLQVFARIKNSGDPEPFDDEDWTRLHKIDNTVSLYSSTSDANNFVELAYGFQPYPNTAFTLSGTASTTNNSNVLVGSNTTWQSNTTANVKSGSLVRIYAPLFGNTDYMVASVNSVANDTYMVLDQVITSNTSLNGNPALAGVSGLAVDLITYENQAYNNILFDNVVRYYNSSIVKYDGYDNLQLKVVMLSSNLQNIPRVHNIRASAVSA